MKKDGESLFRQHALFVGILMLFGIAICFVSFGDGYTKTIEFGYHLSRIYSLTDSLKNGIFPAKIRPVLVHTFGYGEGFFYPDFFLYLPAVMRLAGIPLAVSVKTMIVLMILAGLCLCYISLYKLSDNKLVAFTGTLLYYSVEAFWYALYEEGGVGRWGSHIFLIVTLVGLLLILEEKDGGLIYAIGIVGALLTHPLMFLTLIFAMVLIVLFNLRQLFRGKAFRNFAVYSLVPMVLTSFYWLPAFEQIYHQKFKVFYANIYDAEENVLRFKEVVANVGLVVVSFFAVALLFYLVYCIWQKKTSLIINKLLAIVLIYTWLIVSNSFWESGIGDKLSFFQSSERFIYSLAAIMIIEITYIGGFILKGKEIDNRFLTVAGALLVLVFGLVTSRYIVRYTGFERTPIDEELEYTMLYEHRGISAGMEWLPVETWPDNCTEPNTAHAPDGSGADGTKHDNGKSFDVYLVSGHEYYDMPYIYYYGYKAYVLDGEGNITSELPTQKAENANGHLRVFLPDAYEGDIIHVLVTYRKTAIQIASYIISLVAALSLIVYAVVRSVRRRHSQ